jgi:pentalenene oxygenase
MWRRPLEFLRTLSAHGDLVEIRLGVKRVYVACHPDVVRQMLQDPRTFDKGGPLFDTSRQIVGNGLVTSEWGDHRGQRRMMQPAFHASMMPGYTDIMIEELERQVSCWRPGETVDVRQQMQAATLRIVTRTLFDSLASAETVASVQNSVPAIMEGVYRRMVSPTRLGEKLPTADNRAFDAALTLIHEVIDDLVADYRAAGVDRGDLLSMLMAARDAETGVGLTGQELHDQVLTMYLAGSESTANAMASAFQLISEHPDIEARLHAELDTLPADQAARRAAVPHLEYTTRVTTEVLRIRTPAWLVPRVTTREAELAGQRLAPGTTLLYSPYLVHMDPNLFVEPDRFDPDRWLPERVTPAQRAAMIPFGVGNRMCIGNRFSVIEINAALAAVASRWRLRVVPGTKFSKVPAASLGPARLPMVVQPRTPAESGPVTAWQPAAAAPAACPYHAASAED